MAGGRPPKLNRDQISEIKKIVENGGCISEIAEQYGVNYSTIYYQLGRLKKKPKLTRELKQGEKRKQYKYIKPANQEDNLKEKNLSYNEIIKKQAGIRIIRDEKTGEALKTIRGA